MKSAFFNPQSYFFFGNPILVIDKEGLIGEQLSLKLSKEFLVVFVSRKDLDLDIKNQNIAHVPFFKKFPVIPDAKYSHIIFIDEEGRDLIFLPRIIEKVKNTNADFIFAQGLSLEKKYAVDKILRSYPSAKVVLFGDIFDKRLILRKENLGATINNFLHQAQKFGKIQIQGEGLKETYPVFLQDVVDGLTDLVFGMNKAGSLFYIFPKHPPSELSLAHMIQKINPEIMVDFTKHDPRTVSFSYPPNGKNLLGDRYPIAQKIRGVNIRKKARVYNIVSHKSVKKIKNLSFFIIWTLILLLFSPFIFTLFFSFFGFNTFYYAKKEADKGNFSNAKSSLHLSQTFFYLGRQTFKLFSSQARIVGQENKLQKISENIDLGYKVSGGLLQGFYAEAYFSKVLNGKSKNSIEDFAKGENYLKNSIIALEKIKAEEKIPAPILQNMETINPMIKLLSSVVDILPSVFGMDGPKTYLILFQDNLELRPGGGFIGSYGILKFNSGKITEFSLHDVYEADEQLRGHVEPPFAIRRYLPTQHWYMRDSNFAVDFVKVASSASNFFFVETGQKPDGVIAVDTSFIKSILQVVGSVYLTDYMKVVDENNLYDLIQSDSEKSFPSDSGQKKFFLKSLNQAIIEKEANKEMPFFLIARIISDALAQKHLLLVFNNDSQNIFTVNGWSSSLWDERKNSEGIVNDFMGINEANLGANRVNNFIKRQVLQEITIEDNGSVSEELTIKYKNDSTAWSGGNYKNYLRVILPKNVRLLEISIDDRVQGITDPVTNPFIYEREDFKAPQGLEVEKTQEENKMIFGFLVEVPIGKIVKIKLKYMLPESIAGLNAFSYSLKLFKQPGVDSIPYSLSFVYPNSFNVVKSPSGLNEGEGKAGYSEKIIIDKNLLIDFGKR